MARTYDIHLKTGVGAELARAHLLATGRFTRYGDVLNGGGTSISMFRLDPSNPGHVDLQDYAEEAYGFRPNLSVGVQLDKFEQWEEAERTAVEAITLLAREIGEQSRATYQTDYVVFIQQGEAIVLDETWAAEHPDLVPLVGPTAGVSDLRGSEIKRGVT